MTERSEVALRAAQHSQKMSLQGFYARSRASRPASLKEFGVDRLLKPQKFHPKIEPRIDHIGFSSLARKKRGNASNKHACTKKESLERNCMNKVLKCHNQALVAAIILQWSAKLYDAQEQRKMQLKFKGFDF